MINGFDRNGDGWPEDRPDIGNPGAPLGSRAILWATTGPQACQTGYRNPDTNACTSPADVHWIEGTGFPKRVHRWPEHPVYRWHEQFRPKPSEDVAISEHARLEFRVEAQNALNHPQYVQVPLKDVVNTPAGRFLNRDFTDSGIRNMWVQVKLIF